MDALVDAITRAVVRTGRRRNRAILAGRRSRSRVNTAAIAAKYAVSEELVDRAVGLGILASLENNPAIVRGAVQAYLAGLVMR